jgi:hypothetical protein
MQKKELYTAIAYAERFIVTAKAAVAKIESDSTVTIVGSKETGTCRRASMDLTRALSEMRK